QYIEKVPFDANVYQLRAISYYRIRDYEKSIEDVNLILDKGTKDPALLNLRGVNFRGLNNMEEACKDFLASMKAGDKNGETNYMNYCANKN
ncbi:MAG: hypothetical protein Q8M23_02580, partial [Bacteroidales bacterium]|nr:hypothetical protein [Bacteroidales bacterium]